MKCGLSPQRFDNRNIGIQRAVSKDERKIRKSINFEESSYGKIQQFNENKENNDLIVTKKKKQIKNYFTILKKHWHSAT